MGSKIELWLPPPRVRDMGFSTVLLWRPVFVAQLTGSFVSRFVRSGAAPATAGTPGAIDWAGSCFAIHLLCTKASDKITNRFCCDKGNGEYENCLFRGILRDSGIRSELVLLLLGGEAAYLLYTRFCLCPHGGRNKYQILNEGNIAKSATFVSSSCAVIDWSRKYSAEGEFMIIHPKMRRIKRTCFKNPHTTIRSATIHESITDARQDDTYIL